MADFRDDVERPTMLMLIDGAENEKGGVTGCQIEAVRWV